MDCTVTTDDGVRLHVRVEGAEDAPRLLLSNSLGTDLEMWSPQAQTWARDFRLVRYDARGHGGSDAPAGDYSIERLGRDALAVADALGWTQFSFVGLSMGAMTGLWLALHAPERLHRLVAANGAPFAGGGPAWGPRMEAVRAGGLAAVADGVIERWFTPGFASQGADQLAAIRATLLETSPQGYLGGCAAVRDLDLRPDLARIGVATLLIAGAHDGGPTPAALAAVCKAIPGAALQVLDAAHLSNIEAPAAFDAAVRGFLA